MPTPVTSARQCLTPEAAAALDDAVAVARRRAHSQTTSLHAVSALLSLPSSALRDACSRARTTAYYPTRIQIKALELSLSVFLDRQPSGQKRVEDPPVSNSLMAAIKRSQANQRRHPDNLHAYQQIHQQSSSSPSVSCVKVELKHLILSILDDPVVSRVFGDAGFRSSDVKLSIIRPLPQLLRYPRARVPPPPPLFLCNSGGDSDPGHRPFTFPFLGFSDADEDCRRIAEVLGRNKGRNPLLVGARAMEALRSFAEAVEGRKCRGLPLDISGLSVVCAEIEILNYVTGKCDLGFLNSRFEEVGRMAERCSGPGLVLNYGDLRALIGDDASGTAVNHVVTQLGRLLRVNGGKMWLLGAAESYEAYLMFLSRFPSIESEWDLQLLHITSLRASMAQPYPGSSFMESSVPFGGSFHTLSDLKGLLSSSTGQCRSRCQLCNEKCEQELRAVSKGVFSASIADQYQSSLPPWLHMAELGTNKELDAAQARDDVLVLNAKVAGIQRKWDGICNHLHIRPLSKTVGYEVKYVDNHSSSNTNDAPSENRYKNLNSCMSMDSPKTSAANLSASVPVIYKAKDENFFPRLWEVPLRSENTERGGAWSPCSMSNLSAGNSGTSLSSIASVTTDLGLGISPPNRELQKPLKQPDVKFVGNSSGCHSTSVDICRQFDAKDFKTIFRTLAERIGWQMEAIGVTSQTIARHRASNGKCRGSNLRRDIWLNFLGRDRFGKKKIAVALSEILYGSRNNFINVDFDKPHSHFWKGIIHVNGRNAAPRGNTIVDYIAVELRKNPLSIVFLENVDKADVSAQSSLSHAIRTGKYPDSRGREIGCDNATFITTSRFNQVGGDFLLCESESANHSEERVLRAKSWSMQIVIRHAIGNKRKLMSNEISVQHGTLEIAKRDEKEPRKNLDLNLPAEENEVAHIFSESPKSWVENFFGLVDETVVFKPFDFDVLAEKWTKDICTIFHKLISPECALEIDSRVLEQIVAAACVSDGGDRAVKDWIERILSMGFVEAREKCNLTENTVVRLVAFEGNCLEEQGPEICLPAKIVLSSTP